MYSVFYKPKGSNSSIILDRSGTVKLAEIGLFKNKILDIYYRNFTNQSLTPQEHEAASKLYLLIKERSQLTDSYIDVVWKEMQMWDIK